MALNEELSPFVENFFSTGRLPNKLMIEHLRSVISGRDEYIHSLEKQILHLRAEKAEAENSAIVRKIESLFQEVKNHAV